LLLFDVASTHAFGAASDHLCRVAPLAENLPQKSSNLTIFCDPSYPGARDSEDLAQSSSSTQKPMAISNPEFSESPLMQSVRVNPDALHHHSSTAVLTLAAIGVVFGDIGTSPLYSLKECFAPEHGIPFSTQAVYGIIS
jgi:hypothetical protein